MAVGTASWLRRNKKERHNGNLSYAQLRRRVFTARLTPASHGLYSADDRPLRVAIMARNTKMFLCDEGTESEHLAFWQGDPRDAGRGPYRGWGTEIVRLYPEGRIQFRPWPSQTTNGIISAFLEGYSTPLNGIGGLTEPVGTLKQHGGSIDLPWKDLMSFASVAYTFDHHVWYEVRDATSGNWEDQGPFELVDAGLQGPRTPLPPELLFHAAFKRDAGMTDSAFPRSDSFWTNGEQIYGVRAGVGSLHLLLFQGFIRNQTWAANGVRLVATYSQAVDALLWATDCDRMGLRPLPARDVPTMYSTLTKREGV